MRLSATVVLGFVLVAGGGEAGAQILSRPVRRAPALVSDQARPWKTLTFNVNALAGWDQDASPVFDTTGLSERSTLGTSAFGDASLRFQRGRRQQLFEATGRGFATTFGDVLKPGYGADGFARIDTPIGRRHRLEASEALRSDPLFVIGGFSVLRQELGTGDSPDTNSLNGLEVQRSYVSGSSISGTSQWSRRSSTLVSYRLDVRRFSESYGDATTHSVGVGYRHRTTRRSTLRLDYGFGDSQYEAPERTVPAISHNASIGFDLDRPMSATRGFTVSMGAGASVVRTTTVSSAASEEFFTPTGFIGVRYRWARSWSMSADYRRAVSNLDGLSAESFKTSAVLARIGGLVHRNVDLSGTAGLSNGSSGVSASGFRTWTVGSQFRLRVWHHWWAIVSHSYYRHSLDTIGSGLTFVPSNFDRQSIRMGLSLDLPIYRSRGAQPRQDFE